MAVKSFSRYSTASILLLLIFLSTPAAAFGAGYVSRGSHSKATNFRHGDIALAVPLFAIANRRLVKQIYFGNWLRDFSQLLDRGSLSLVPRPVLRALVAVFAYVQFGYATREFEVTDERLGFYRPEEHVDNPRGYDDGTFPDSANPQPPSQEESARYQISEGLRAPVRAQELAIDSRTGMKNYIANSPEVGAINPTSADYVEKQLIAAVACGRQGEPEAYIHLGAAMHTLEDFVAHSNYVELAMQMIGQDIQDRTQVTPALRKVFDFVGGNARVQTARGHTAPITTGTFGALDLYQTLLGEIDDKLNAMSLPGLSVRTSEKGGALQKVAGYLIDLLGGLTPDFGKNIASIQQAAANSKPATWGELEESPEKLWKSLEPVFKLRDDIVKWVYDNLTVRAVQDALAAISTAIDKMVYMVLGIFLGPLLSEFSKILKEQEQELQAKDEAVRLSKGEESIFDSSSSATDPTHSQLAKDHYDHVLNEIAGRVAVRISTYTTTAIVQLWTAGDARDPRPAIQGLLQAFHHPFNCSAESPIQTLMLDEVRAFVNESLVTRTEAFEEDLRSLSASAVASRVSAHTHHPSGLAEERNQVSVPRDSAQHADITARLTANIERQLQKSPIKGIGMNEISSLLLSPPSGESPNPLDSGLAKLPGVSFLALFEGIDVSEIAAAEGMGETLKDAVVSMILLDEQRSAREEDAATQISGKDSGRSREEEKAYLRDLKGMLEIEKIKKKRDEIEWAQVDEKKTTGDKMKDSFARLKLRAVGKS